MSAHFKNYLAILCSLNGFQRNPQWFHCNNYIVFFLSLRFGALHLNYYLFDMSGICGRKTINIYYWKRQTKNSIFLSVCLSKMFFLTCARGLLIDSNCNSLHKKNRVIFVGDFRFILSLSLPFFLLLCCLFVTLHAWVCNDSICYRQQSRLCFFPLFLCSSSLKLNQIKGEFLAFVALKFRAPQWNVYA